MAPETTTSAGLAGARRTNEASPFPSGRTSIDDFNFRPSGTPAIGAHLFPEAVDDIRANGASHPGGSNSLQSMTVPSASISPNRRHYTFHTSSITGAPGTAAASAPSPSHSSALSVPSPQGDSTIVLDAATGVITVCDTFSLPPLQSIAPPRDGQPMTVRWLCGRIVERFGFYPARGSARHDAVSLRNLNSLRMDPERVLHHNDFGQTGVGARLAAGNARCRCLFLAAYSPPAWFVPVFPVSIHEF
jgi:hypothetical protein